MSLGGAIGRNQRVTENQKKITHRAPLKGKRLCVSVPLWFLETLQLRNHRDAEAQRTKKEGGIVLPEKKVKKTLCLCSSVALGDTTQLRNHRDAEAQRTKKEREIMFPEKR
jgi:hypothetical protein